MTRQRSDSPFINCRRLLAGIAAALLLLGCNAPAASPLPPTASFAPPTSTTVSTPTQPIPTAAAAPTQRASPTLAATATSLSSPTVTAVAATALPTLPSDDREDYIRQLMATNGDCRLPCWWGITPGVTPWDFARRFFEPFASQLSIPDSATSPLFTVSAFFFPPPRELISPYLEVRLTVSNMTVETLDVSGFEWPGYLLAPFLTDYGLPPEVFVSTLRTTTTPSRPFILVLYDADRGILATYSTDAERADSLLRGCFDGSASLLLWSGHPGLPFAEAAK